MSPEFKSPRHKRAHMLREDPHMVVHGSAYIYNAYICRDNCPGGPNGLTCRQAHALKMKERRAAAKNASTSEN